jgi:hypothetical protein
MPLTKEELFIANIDGRENTGDLMDELMVKLSMRQAEIERMFKDLEGRDEIYLDDMTPSFISPSEETPVSNGVWRKGPRR